MKKYNESLSILDTIFSIYPEQAFPHFYIGIAYYKNNNIKKAIAHLQKSLQLAPKVSNTYYFLSLSFLMNGEYENALNHYQYSETKIWLSILYL